MALLHVDIPAESLNKVRALQEKLVGIGTDMQKLLDENVIINFQFGPGPDGKQALTSFDAFYRAPIDMKKLASG